MNERTTSNFLILFTNYHQRFTIRVVMLAVNNTNFTELTKHKINRFNNLERICKRNPLNILLVVYAYPLLTGAWMKCRSNLLYVSVFYWDIRNCIYNDNRQQLRLSFLWLQLFYQTQSFDPQTFRLVWKTIQIKFTAPNFCDTFKTNVVYNSSRFAMNSPFDGFAFIIPPLDVGTTVWRSGLMDGKVSFTRQQWASTLHNVQFWKVWFHTSWML